MSDPIFLAFGSVYAALGLAFGIRYWPATNLAPPHEYPAWERVCQCFIVGILWIFFAIQVLWREM